MMQQEELISKIEYARKAIELQDYQTAWNVLYLAPPKAPQQEGTKTMEEIAKEILIKYLEKQYPHSHLDTNPTLHNFRGDEVVKIILYALRSIETSNNQSIKELERIAETNIIFDFLHRHPKMEEKLGLDKDHVIVDRQDWIKARSENL